MAARLHVFPVNARVLIDGPSELVFGYAIPAHLNVHAGCRVRIPLRRKSATGTVRSIGMPEQEDFALRELESLIDPEPLITPVSENRSLDRRLLWI